MKSKIETALKYACDRSFGVLDSGFLCQSLSILEPAQPRCVREFESLDSVCKLLQSNKMGCVLIVDQANTLIGIFSERDYILKIYGSDPAVHSKPISEYMTTEPVSAGPVTTIAFALNLMSHGGFRHLPIVDDENKPVGMISVKDVVDYLVNSFIDDVLNLNLSVTEGEH